MPFACPPCGYLHAVSRIVLVSMLVTRSAVRLAFVSRCGDIAAHIFALQRDGKPVA